MQKARHPVDVRSDMLGGGWRRKKEMANFYYRLGTHEAATQNTVPEHFCQCFVEVLLPRSDGGAEQRPLRRLGQFPEL